MMGEDNYALAIALAERNRAFENDDLGWAQRQMPFASSHKVVLMAFHKARYECVAVSTTKRLESQRWLATNTVKRLTGEPIKIGAPLPI